MQRKIFQWCSVPALPKQEKRQIQKTWAAAAGVKILEQKSIYSPKTNMEPENHPFQ